MYGNATVAELLTRGGEWSTPSPDRASDTRRWAYYRLGAFMCAMDTGKLHGPQVPPFLMLAGCIIGYQDGRNGRTYEVIDPAAPDGHDVRVTARGWTLDATQAWRDVHMPGCIVLGHWTPT